jgi:hypothetical protein
MSLFSSFATLVALASFPGGYWLARKCAKGTGGRIALTLVFGIVFLVVGVLAVLICCSAAGKLDFK